MKGKAFALIGLAALGLFALACTSETTVLSPDQEAPGISVSGSGSVFGEPDIAVLSLGVSATADSVGAARSQAAEAMDAMLTALKDGGVADDDIQTTRFSVQPLYDYIEGRTVLRGFSVDNIVTAKIHTIDDTGKLIDAALAAGGDLSRVDNLQFTIDDPAALGDQAREKAMEEAKRKAETLARVAGVKLGLPRSISENRAPVPPMDFLRAAELAQTGPAETPIELGQLEVRVDVQVVYGLETD